MHLGFDLAFFMIPIFASVWPLFIDRMLELLLHQTLLWLKSFYINSIGIATA